VASSFTLVLSLGLGVSYAGFVHATRLAISNHRLKRTTLHGWHAGAWLYPVGFVVAAGADGRLGAYEGVIYGIRCRQAAWVAVVSGSSLVMFVDASICPTTAKYMHGDTSPTECDKLWGPS
jgi:hypothetical protein